MGSLKYILKEGECTNLKAKEYRQFEDIKYVKKDGRKYWSVRELVDVLDYSWWRNFQKVIDRAMIACELSPVTISKMSRGELICIDVLYRIGTKLDVDFCDMMSIKKINKISGDKMETQVKRISLS